MSAYTTLVSNKSLNIIQYFTGIVVSKNVLEIPSMALAYTMMDEPCAVESRIHPMVNATVARILVYFLPHSSIVIPDIKLPIGATKACTLAVIIQDRNKTITEKKNILTKLNRG